MISLELYNRKCCIRGGVIEGCGICYRILIKPRNHKLVVQAYLPALFVVKVYVVDILIFYEM